RGILVRTMSQAALQRLLGRLYASRRAGVVLGLERVERCLAALGHPEQRMGMRVHVGGTNGKGSTVAFVEAICRAAGQRTARFTSPHLVRFAERFVIDGQPAPDDLILAAGEAVAAAGGDGLTFFEQVTAMGLWMFAEAGVDTAILEVGLGGRLDATNAVPAEIAAVTGVALDHQDWLGSTLAAIAAEKAGIFKPGQRVVIGRAGEPEAVPWLASAATAARVAACTVVDAPVPPDWPLGLGGQHQRDNAACALAIARHLAVLGHLPDDETLWRQGLARARFPGRLEPVAPGVFLDGAHNPHGAAALGRTMAALPAPRVLVLATSRDKDVAGIASALAGHAQAVVATAYGQERALPAAELAAIVRAVAPAVPCTEAPDCTAALAQARALAGPGGTVLVAGSLFLVGEARQVLCGERPDPVPLSDPLGPLGATERAGRGRTPG
ncbi:MAG TPA: Mur ligase family protein, partial [Haliangium sp.]|nr:Mur ligase family protein [Haliangium sp.]